MRANHSFKSVFLKFLPVIFLLIVTNCKKGNDKPNIETGTVTDINGNVYMTVKIGTQWWMAENLKVTRYRNGDPIPNITDTTNWMKLTTGSYWWYNNDTVFKKKYGALYNWYAVIDSRNIAPIGWHVPTDAEWCQMMIYLDATVYCEQEGVVGTDVGSKLKASEENWCSSKGGETNETGFSAVPGGYRSGMGYFLEYCCLGLWWTSTELDSVIFPPGAWYRDMSHYYPGVWRSVEPKWSGLSVRCVKDSV